jgi:hypothetical protein
MRRRRNRRAAWIGLGMAMLAGACTPADSADQNEGEDTGSGRNDVAAASMRPAAALSFGDVGVYGSHWVEYLASEPAAFDFLMYQARVYSQAPGDVAGELSLLSDVGVRLAVVVMFFEHKAQRAAWDGAPALREPEYYEVLFDQLLNETASLDIDAFTMDEENVAQNSEFLSDLYGRVKQRHPERNFYQWYSPTRKPNLAIPGKTRPAMPADGWVIDNYGVSGSDFFEYIGEMNRLDKPLLAVVWASPQWQVGDRSRRPNTRWWDRQGWKVFHSKLATYQYYDVPVAFFMFAPLDPDNPGYIPLYRSAEECSQRFFQAFRTRTIPHLRSRAEIPQTMPSARPDWIPGHCG